MAQMSLNVKSRILLRNVNITVIVSDNYLIEPENLKIGYFLHGMGDDDKSYYANTKLEHYIREENMMIVCPSVSNSFYTNMHHGDNYYDFVAKELPALINNLFNINVKKENKFIAGLSMGAYGALRIGILENSFGGIGVMSGGIDSNFIVMNSELLPNFDPKLIFGESLDIVDNEYDVFYLIKTNSFDSKIFISCGDNDIFYGANNKLYDMLKEKDCEFHIIEGGHDWNVWDLSVAKLIKWMRQ